MTARPSRLRQFVGITNTRDEDIDKDVNENVFRASIKRLPVRTSERTSEREGEWKGSARRIIDQDNRLAEQHIACEAKLVQLIEILEHTMKENRKLTQQLQDSQRLIVELRATINKIIEFK